MKPLNLLGIISLAVHGFNKKAEVNKMSISMYELVKHGYLINLSLVFALLAILSRLALGIIYDYLLKETENIGMAKSKFGRNYKTKVSSSVGMERPVHNVVTFVEKYIRKQRYLGISLRGWKLTSIRLMLLAVIVNVFVSAYAIIKNMKTELIVWSIMINVLAVLLFFLAEMLIDSSYKYEGIKINMQNYVENDYVNHCNAIKEAEAELESKESEQNVKLIEERMEKIEEKLMTTENKSLSPSEAKVIQDVLKEFLA